MFSTSALHPRLSPDYNISTQSRHSGEEVAASVYALLSTFTVCVPLKVATGTYVTSVYSLCGLSSSSLRLRARHTRTRYGTLRTPCDQMCLLRRVSMRTSWVPICFSANFFSSLMARGARCLKPMPWMLVQVDGVLPGGQLVNGRLLLTLALCGCH